jgi:chromosome segregation ATPase
MNGQIGENKEIYHRLDTLSDDVGALKHGFDTLQRAFRAFEQRFDALLDFLKENMVTRSEFNEHKEAVDNRFLSIERRLDSMDSRFDALDRRFDGIEQRLDNSEARLDLLSRDLDQIKLDLALLSKRTKEDGDALAKEVIHLSQRIDVLERRIAQMQRV